MADDFVDSAWRVLAHLQAANSMLHILPTLTKIGEFVSQAICTVPGISACSMCGGGLSGPVGNLTSDICSDCTGSSLDWHIGNEYDCLLMGSKDLHVLSLKTVRGNYGYVIMKVKNRERFSHFESFLDNFANSVAITLENRWQSRELEEKNQMLIKFRDHLQELVNERTAELKRSNEMLASEIEERKLVEIALRKSEENFRSLFMNVPLGLYRTKPDGTIVDANPTLIEKMGYQDFDSMASKNLNEVYVYPEDRKRWMSMIEKKDLIRGFEIQLRRKDGQIIWMKNNTRAIRDEQGNVLLYEGSLEDVTEEKHKELEMKRKLMSFKLEEGHIYLAQESMPSLSLDAMKDLLEVGYRGVVISRKPEPDMRQMFRGEYLFHWLSEKDGDDMISPDITQIEEMIEQGSWSSGYLIDRLDYLIRKNGYERILQSIQNLRDIAYLTGSIIIFSLDPGTVSKKQLLLLSKECNDIEPTREITMNDKLYEVLRYVYRQNIIGLKPYYMHIRKELGISKPTISKRVYALTTMGLVREEKKGRSKIVELTDKGRQFFWD